MDLLQGLLLYITVQIIIASGLFLAGYIFAKKIAFATSLPFCLLLGFLVGTLNQLLTVANNMDTPGLVPQNQGFINILVGVIASFISLAGAYLGDRSRKLKTPQVSPISPVTTPASLSDYPKLKKQKREIIGLILLTALYYLSNLHNLLFIQFLTILNPLSFLPLLIHLYLLWIIFTIKDRSIFQIKSGIILAYCWVALLLIPSISLLLYMFTSITRYGTGGILGGIFLGLGLAIVIIYSLSLLAIVDIAKQLRLDSSLADSTVMS